MKRLLLLLVVAAFLALGCDETRAVSIENRSTQTLLIGRIGMINGEPGSNVVGPAGPNQRWKVGAFGVGADMLILEIVVMTENCEVLSTNEEIGQTFLEGGVIVVERDLTTTYHGGGNPPEGESTDLTNTCRETVKALEPPPQP